MLICFHHLLYLFFSSSSNRRSRPEVFCKKDVFSNFTKFTGKHLCQSLFLIKLQTQACNFIKKDAQAQIFSCEFCEISKNTTIFTEHLQATASDLRLTICWVELKSTAPMPTIKLFTIFLNNKFKKFKKKTSKRKTLFVKSHFQCQKHLVCLF